MSNNLVITIGRSFGSGGREIGKKRENTQDEPQQEVILQLYW